MTSADRDRERKRWRERERERERDKGEGEATTVWIGNLWFVERGAQCQDWSMGGSSVHQSVKRRGGSKQVLREGGGMIILVVSFWSMSCPPPRPTHLISLAAGFVTESDWPGLVLHPPLVTGPGLVERSRLLRPAAVAPDPETVGGPSPSLEDRQNTHEDRGLRLWSRSHHRLHWWGPQKGTCWAWIRRCSANVKGHESLSVIF